MVNTESFNYGNPTSNIKKEKGKHNEFDVSPVSEDSYMKNEWKIKQNFKKEYPPALDLNKTIESFYYSDRTIQGTYPTPKAYREDFIKKYGEKNIIDDFYEEKIGEKDYKGFVEKWRKQK